MAEFAEMVEKKCVAALVQWLYAGVHVYQILGHGTGHDSPIGIEDVASIGANRLIGSDLVLSDAEPLASLGSLDEDNLDKYGDESDRDDQDNQRETQDGSSLIVRHN